MERIGLQDKRIARQVRESKLRAAAQRAATAEDAQGAGGDGLRDRGSDGGGARPPRRARSEPRLARRGAPAQAGRDLRFARDARGLPRGGRRARRGERRARRVDSRGSGAGGRHGGGFRRTGRPVCIGLHLAGERPGCERLRVRWGRMHEGIDITASTGTPIWAAADGTVIWSSWRGGYGNCVVVDHGNGLATLYAHASALLVVGRSARVARGDDRARRLDRELLGAALALRGAGQRRRRRSAALPLTRHRSGRATRFPNLAKTALQEGHPGPPPTASIT